MRLAIAKPDYGIVGGFELVLRHFARGLEAAGHTVDWLLVDVASLPRAPFGVAVPDDIWDQAPEFFRYAAMVEAFERLDTSGYDVVISTQPPSWALRHEAHVAIFYHHLRIYYDLADVYVDSGLAGDRDLFEVAREHVHEIDNRILRNPKWVLTPSESVRGRLRRFNGLSDNLGSCHAGPAVAAAPGPPDGRTFEFALCVSRHEFPKRTELFVHAMKFLAPRTTGVVVGEGGRLPFVQALDARLSQPGVDLDAVDARSLWVSSHAGAPPAAPTTATNVRFLGRVPADDLADLYDRALCVVAPAYLEDYGLTAIEAMQHAKPVIVCDDGGGLVEFIDDGVNGFVVEPTGRAIADAVERLHAEPERAREMGKAAFETSTAFTWERAVQEVEDGIAQVLS